MVASSRVGRLVAAALLTFTLAVPLPAGSGLVASVLAAAPTSVTIAGSLQSEVGCSGDWQPDCATTHLTYDSSDDVWQGSWTIPAGNWEYKAAIDDAWAENYGAGGVPNGPNVTLTLASPTVVKFYYDPNSHWITDNRSARIVTAPGSYQTELGCPGDWDPGCLRSWLQDLDADGTFTLTTTALPAGNYESKAAINEAWDENYGVGGTPGGSNIAFNVPFNNASVVFRFVSGTNTLTIQAGASHDNDIWWNDLGHDSRDGLYRTPGGAVATNTPVKVRLRAASGDLTSAKVRVWNDRNNAQSLLDMSIAADDGEYEWWEATIPASSDPTIYWYRFIAHDGTATAYYEDDAARTGGWGETFGSSPDNGWQLTVYDAGFTTPEWVKNATIYQIFPDRFRDGNAANDTPPNSFFYNEAGSIVRSDTTDWNASICDPRDATGDCPGIYGQNFYGGDLQGIIDKLGYLQGIGVNAIYLNPIFKAPSNHKYDTTDYGQIDPAFGSLADFQALTAAIHARGMHLILDGVFNHTSSDSVYFDRYSRYGSIGACESSSSAYRDWYYFSGSGPCDGQDYTSWFGFDSLPKLNAYSSEVRDLIWQGSAPSPSEAIAKYWLQQGADGWRLDVGGDVDPGVTNDTSNNYWEGFRNAVKGIDPDAYIVGEEWGNATPWTLGPEWDATMNYQFSSALLSLFRDETLTDNDHNFSSSAGELAPLSPSGFAERLQNLQERYPAQSFYALLNLLDSHDTNRALFLLDENADESATTRATYEDPNYDWSDAITRLKGVALLQATLPGAPTIYYGDEVGLVAPPTKDSGVWQDDPYNRAAFPWLDASGTPYYTFLQSGAGQDDIRDQYSLLFNARADHPALRTGSLDFLLEDDANATLAYGRRMADYSDAAVVVLNRSASQRDVTVNVSGYVPDGATFNDVLTNAPYTVTAGELVINNVPANGGALLVLTSSITAPPAAPQDLSVTATGVSSGSLKLSWTSTGGATYEVYRSLLSGGGYEVVGSGTPKAAGMVEDYVDSGLTNGTTYHYVVLIRDANGLSSGFSNDAAGTPGYDLNSAWDNVQWPPSLTHTISTTTPTDNVYGQIYIDGVTQVPGPTPGLRAQVGFGPDATTPDDSWTWAEMSFNVQSGNNDEFVGNMLPESVGSFDYTVRYSGDGGNNWHYALEGPGGDPNPIRDMTVNASSDTTPPSVPTLSLMGVNASQVELSWTASNDETALAGYYVFRDGTRIATLDDSTTTYADDSVTTGVAYDYTVKGFDTSFNKSDASNTVTVRAENRMVDVSFTVGVPSFTPADATVYITGSVDALGPWNPNAYAMADNGDGTWSRTFSIPDGTSLEYKYTRGSWETVESWGTIVGLANRHSTVDYGATGTQTVDDTATDWGVGSDDHKAVRNWADPLVTSFTPLDGATGVASSTTVVVNWSRAMASDSDFTVAGPGGAVSGSFALSNSDQTLTFTPTSALPDGDYDVNVSGQSDADGNGQQVGTTFSFTVGSGGGGDTQPPVVGDVMVNLRERGKVTTAPVLVTWSSEDETSADATLVHQIQYRRYANGAWGAWQTGNTVTGREYSNWMLPNWREFQFRVRSRDEAVNWSDWSDSNTILVLRRQERHFTLSSGWSTVSMTGAMGGKVAVSSTPGATARLRFTGYGVGAVMPVKSGYGTVEICVDPGTLGETCTTVNLSTFTPTGNRRLVAVFTGLAAGSHSLQVKVISGTVRLDGALISQTGVPAS